MTKLFLSFVLFLFSLSLSGQTIKDTSEVYFLRKCTKDDIHFGYLITLPTGFVFMNDQKKRIYDNDKCPVTRIISIEAPLHPKPSPGPGQIKRASSVRKQGYTR